MRRNIPWIEYLLKDIQENSEFITRWWQKFKKWI